MSGWFGTEKRKATEEDNVLHSEKNHDVSEELIAMKSTINELLNQTRTQTDNMTSMMQLMSSMQGEIKNMRRDMNALSNKCDGLQNSIQSIHRNSLIDNNMIRSRFDDVEEQIEDLDTRFGHAHDKLNYHYILLKNQKWEYSAYFPPDHYWVDSDASQAEAESFLKVIKKNTELIRYGQIGDGQIDLNEIEVDDYYISYDEAFLPHWEEFFTAIRQYQYYLKVITNDDESESVLDLCNVELPEEVIDLMAEALETTYFNTLDMSWNNFGQKGIRFVLDYLQRNSKCKKLCLNYNVMSSEDVNQLCQIVKDHPSIERLSLCGCKDEDFDGYDMLQRIMRAARNKLKSLDLGDSNIKTGGDTFISDFLAGNPMLRSLHLHINKLDDNDAAMIATALKHNTNLKILDLQLLHKAVFDKTSLNSAADSNHTCRVCFPDNEGVGARELNSYLPPRPAKVVWYDPIYVRQKKVYSVLSARNRSLSNVDHFDEDMPVELLPHILTSIEQYSNYHDVNSLPEDTIHPPPHQDTQDVKPLSIMFEILQRWDKSLANFEALSS